MNGKGNTGASSHQALAHLTPLSFATIRPAGSSDTSFQKPVSIRTRSKSSAADGIAERLRAEGQAELAETFSTAR